MEVARCRILSVLLMAVPLCCVANDTLEECPRTEVDAHVRSQLETYGPLSIKHEFFGFIYRYDGEIRSSVIRGRDCPNPGSCEVNTAVAASSIPRGAKILGEWHTHPKGGSRTLSTDDVRGAHNNRHIRCYVAFYSKPGGEIYAWDPNETSVPTAMASLMLIGNYTARLVEAADKEVRYAHTLD